MSTAIEDLGLMRVQIEDGSVHTVEEAIQLVIDYLMEIASSGDSRALRYSALLGGVHVSVGVFAESLTRVPMLVELCKELRPKMGNATLRISDLSYAENDA